MRPIWIVGGTGEGVEIATRLDARGLDWWVTVTMPRAAGRYCSLGGGVDVIFFAEQSAIAWARERRIAGIVDASHPFATQISQVAIATARHLDIPYLRYERPRVPLVPETVVVPNIAATLRSPWLENRRVLLTTGIKTLPLFRDWHARSHLYARILPTPSSQEAAIAAGFPLERTIAQQLPIAYQQELDLWRSLHLDTVVTKAAGMEGGLHVKQAVASELGVQLITIARPVVTYPKQTSQYDEVLAFCQYVLQ